MTSPQGWAELLAWTQQQSMAGKLDAEEAWRFFRDLAATSAQAGLPELASRFDLAPAGDRLILAVTSARMLAPVEWPLSWVEPRRRLASTLDEIVRDAAPDAIAQTFELTLDEADLYRAGWNDLIAARDLLRVPCRRDELRTVGRLCDAGNFARRRALGRALLRLGERATAQVIAARDRHAISFEVYAAAARSMNGACGTVMFGGLDFSLGQVKAG